MEEVTTNIHVSAPESLGFGPSLEIRAYLLRRQDGNLLIYRSRKVEDDESQIRSLGGISRQYLNHHHEASPVTNRIAETFAAPLYVHADDAKETAGSSTVDETFTDRHTLGDDFEVIPTPGHTAGATTYLFDTGEHRAIFTGDTLFYSRGRWRAAVLEGVSDRDKYIESLELMRTLDFDLIIPGIAPAGQPFYQFIGKLDADEMLDKVITRIRNGEDG